MLVTEKIADHKYLGMNQGYRFLGSKVGKFYEKFLVIRCIRFCIHVQNKLCCGPEDAEPSRHGAGCRCQALRRIASFAPVATLQHNP